MVVLATSFYLCHFKNNDDDDDICWGDEIWIFPFLVKVSCMVS